ncbi:hypothetical protein V6N11_059403 [Hibiscus sabdariffa]|uniref:RRM domain-containing protein n=1 Tax=Hibiscus sabdariffa TaxID=183260 RepID=A0ABR2AF71_9ROSI
MSENGKLFIGGYLGTPMKTVSRSISVVFGEVVEAVIMKDRTTGRARGFGFVVSLTRLLQRELSRRNTTLMAGWYVEAKKAVPRDDQNITSRSTGSIHGSPSPDVVVMYDHNTQRPRGFGFITYDAEEAVDKVLLKNFHELNGKMVEVKRAVPRELSPAPSPGPLGGYNFALNRINNFLNGYTLMDILRAGLNPSFGNGASFSSNMSYGQGLSPYYISTTNRFDNPIGYDSSGEVGGNNISSNSVSFGYRSGDNNFGLGTAGYERNDLSGGALVYGDTTWQSSISEQDGSGNLDYGLGSATSDVMDKSSPGFLGGYNVNKRQGK